MNYLYLVLIVNLCACGSGSNLSLDELQFEYSLDRTHVGKPINRLKFKYPEGLSYQFLIRGENFQGSVLLDAYHLMQPEVELSFIKEGRYSIFLKIIHADGTAFLEDTLEWHYSTKIPKPPIIGFTEKETRDSHVTLTVAASRDPDDNEIWAEGDLAGAHTTGGFWDSLSFSGLYLLRVTEEDGTKGIRVKLRNIYGNESSFTQTAINKDSKPPIQCDAILAGPGSASSKVKVQLFGQGDNPLFYNVFGDIKEIVQFKEFSDGEFIEISINGEEGLKSLQFEIQDLAGNTCEIKRTLLLSSGYVTHNIEIVNKPYWTRQSVVDLNIRYDHFPDAAPVEMRLTGDITDQDSDTWIPYQDKKTATLTPNPGQKRIFVQFRDQEKKESFLVQTQVYLNPSLTTTSISENQTNISISKIIGTKSIAITGCVEKYDNQSHQEVFICTPNHQSIQATYTFQDQSTLTIP